MPELQNALERLRAIQVTLPEWEQNFAAHMLAIADSSGVFTTRQESAIFRVIEIYDPDAPAKAAAHLAALSPEDIERAFRPVTPADHARWQSRGERWEYLKGKTV